MVVTSQVGDATKLGMRQEGQPTANGAATVRRLQAVKQEVPEPSRSSKDPDRQAKIKALAAQIRAKARRAAEEEDAEVEPEEAPRMPPDEQDTTRLEGMIQGLDQKVAHTEDEIERIGILAAPLSMEVTEDIKDGPGGWVRWQELQANAIRDTERAVRAAKLNFDSALRDVDRAEREVAALAAPDQAQFSASLAQLKERLQETTVTMEAQGKLEDHKNVRRDYEQAAQAGKAFGDLASRLSTVEMDCDKAAIMAEPVAKILDTNPLDRGAFRTEAYEVERFTEPAFQQFIALARHDDREPFPEGLENVSGPGTFALADLERLWRNGEFSADQILTARSSSGTRTALIASPFSTARRAWLSECTRAAENVWQRGDTTRLCMEDLADHEPEVAVAASAEPDRRRPQKAHATGLTLELSAADLRETKEAVRIAQAKLAPIARLITAKASGLRGLMLERMTELQARAQSCQAQLDKAQQTMDEAQSRASALPLLKQASERLAAVEEILEKMRETEAPFLMGIENLPPEETLC
eukprot:s2840_g4.t1